MNSAVSHDETRLAEARLGSPPADSLIQYRDLPALLHEKHHFREFACVDLAHTVMLAEQNIVSADVARSILAGLLELRDQDPETFPVDPVKGSFLLQVESFLSERMREDVAGQMHTGRSRIDQGATVCRLHVRGRLIDVMDRLNDFRAVLIEQANAHSRTIMPGYTHLQHAQPWVFGHYLLSLCTRLADDCTRLRETYARTNLNPLGSVGLAGTSWPLDRARTTELLGFSAVLENSKLGKEAFYAAEGLGTLSLLMATLNDLATDLHMWSASEFGFVESDDAFCGTSSIFPQKKNPTGLETVKRAAGESVTWLAGALACFRSEGTGDQAMRELPQIDGALDTTEGMLHLFTDIMATLIVHEDRMRAALSGSWCTASNLADVIVRETGLSFRQVHHVVARLVRICLAEDITPDSVTGAVLERAAQQTIGVNVSLSDPVLRQALDPVAFVNTRATAGSVAPGEVSRMVEVAQAQLLTDRSWLATERSRVLDAAARLNAAVEHIVSAQGDLDGFPS